jgi:hypothetical protein
MKKLAQWLMTQAALEEFPGIQIDCAHEAVTRVWLLPPEPFTAQLVANLILDCTPKRMKKGRPFILSRMGSKS